MSHQFEHATPWCGISKCSCTPSSRMPSETASIGISEYRRRRALSVVHQGLLDSLFETRRLIVPHIAMLRVKHALGRLLEGSRPHRILWLFSRFRFSELCCVVGQVPGPGESSNCVMCSQVFSSYAQSPVGVERLRALVESDISESSRRTILQHLCTMMGQCKPQQVFLLYRYVFKPLLDSFYANKSGKLPYLHTSAFVS